MLTPDARTILLDDLQAPPGYAVAAAVATTFTLDLTAAMLPPLALAGIGAGSTGRDPIALLQALRHASDKVDIFCQAGSIGVPRSVDLVAFLEPMVHQVIPPNGSLFHPKIWLLRFTTDDAPARYRLLILSRNLTHDNTWDVAVRLDSESLDDHPQQHNEALTGLLRWLPDQALHIDRSRRDRLLSLADEVAHVHWERPDHVESITFHAGGVPGQPAVELSAGAHLVISPFVTPEGLELATMGHVDTPILISRQESLDALPLETLEGITAYTMTADTEVPITDDTAVDESASAPVLSGLHAKIYVLEPTDKWTKARVLMGSSNATGPGLKRNIEFLVEVFGRREHLGITEILPPDGSSTGGIRPLVERYARQEVRDQTEERTRRRLQRDLRSFASINHLIEIHEEPDMPAPTYSATVTADRAYSPREGVSVRINFLTRPGSTALVEGRPHLTVSQLETAHITPCIAVTATEGNVSESTVILGQLVGSPEGRLDAVIASQVNDKDKFRRLLLLLLSLGNPAELAALLAEEGDGDGSTGPFSHGFSGILELVLRGLGSHSDAIDDVDRLIGALDSDVFPEGFEAFWEQVRQARLLLEENGS